MSLSDKFTNGEEFTESEIKSLVFGYHDEPIQIIDEIEGDDHRWDREVKTIINVNGVLYAIEWRRALTETQENSFYNQPYKVIQRTKIIEVNEYVKV